MNEQTYPWYMVNKDGVATLCADHADAEQAAMDDMERMRASALPPAPSTEGESNE